MLETCDLPAVMSDLVTINRDINVVDVHESVLAGFRRSRSAAPRTHHIYLYIVHVL